MLVESVATCSWIRWPHTRGIRNQLAIEAETPGVPIDRFRLGDQTITDATFRAKTGISSEVD